MITNYIESAVKAIEEQQAKVKGGAGYKEAIEYMNEHCGTKVEIPKV